MPNWLPDYVTSYVLPIGGAAVGLAAWVCEKFNHRKTEKELAEIRRRATGPYLQAMQLRVTTPVENKSRLQIVHRGETLPDNLPDGSSLELALDNSDGQAVVAVSAQLPQDWQFLHHAGVFGRAPCVGIIRYSFAASELGIPVHLRFDFEAQGVKTHHVYETRHGFCELKRIDPV